MNRTTVKRGIGAVILALIAAALLAFLLKDKATQRQEVVEIALPGTDSSAESSNLTTRLPTLNTENSGSDGNGDGSVIANAGSGNGDSASSQINGNTGNNASNGNASGASGGDTSGTGASGNNPDGTIIASAAAVGTAAAGAAALASGAATGAAKSIDFSVKPRVATSKASSEFLDLDLVNNGSSPSTTANASANSGTAAVAIAAGTAAVAASAGATASTKVVASSGSNDSQGIVIASTSPKSSGSNANVVQPRLIGEKKSAPVKSARTAKVISSKKATTKSTAAASPETAPAATKQAKNGYAIQLLATSSVSRANNLKKVMAGEGYPTYVTKTKQNGKTLYRVRIGQYSVKSQAVKAQAAMKRRYKKNTNVTRSAVVAR